ncbi:hypothetical protein [Haliangium sp.]|uniref:hypothetical protein n=1 Tax=Haliangium sp. TaxID=2663208 RepID=UPI003D0ADF1F
MKDVIAGNRVAHAGGGDDSTGDRAQSEGETSRRGYKTQSPDTSEEAERLLFERYRTMEPWEKAQLAAELSRAVDQLALAGLRLRHPDADERELRMRLAATRIDRETMIQAFGWDPDQHAP